jgi:hypothetical protein
MDRHGKPGRSSNDAGPLGRDRLTTEISLNLSPIDHDWVAFRALEARGVVRMLEPGIELLVSEVGNRSKYDLVSVRRQGSPDTFYVYRYSFECPKKPKAK